MEADFDKWLAEHVKESVPVNDGELPAGTRVGEYRIVALLGRGGFANVYRANGTLVEQATIDVKGGKARFSVAHLEPGFYVAKATNDSGTRVSCKFMK